MAAMARMMMMGRICLFTHSGFTARQIIDPCVRDHLEHLLDEPLDYLLDQNAKVREDVEQQSNCWTVRHYGFSNMDVTSDSNCV